jgi:hypothetical protein
MVAAILNGSRTVNISNWDTPIFYLGHLGGKYGQCPPSEAVADSHRLMARGARANKTHPGDNERALSPRGWNAVRGGSTATGPY